MNHDKPNN